MTVMLLSNRMGSKFICSTNLYVLQNYHYIPQLSKIFFKNKQVFIKKEEKFLVFFLFLLAKN